MNNPPRFCMQCGRVIPNIRRKDSIYCSDGCRKISYEKRNPHRKNINNKKRTTNEIVGVGVIKNDK